MIFLAEFSVIKPDIGLLFWSTVIFILFWVVVGSLAFKPIVRALKKREQDIQNSLDEAKRAREEMANLKAENEELLRQAREERSRILREAKEIGDKMVAEAKEKAKEEARRIVTEAKEQIENQKRAAMIEVKNELGMMAIQIAEKILRKNLAGDKEQEAYVQSLIDEIKLN